MLDNQIFELLDKLKKVNYETINIDDFLDQRECDPFDSEWVRVYQAIEELKKGKEMVDTREIEKKAYWTIVNKKDTIFKYIFWERLDSLPIPECCFHFVWCQIA